MFCVRRQSGEGSDVDHATEEEIERFMAGGLEPDRFRRILRHLLSGCPVCERRLGPLGVIAFRRSAELDVADDSMYDAVLDRAFGRVAGELARAGREKERRERLVAAARRNRQGIGGVLDQDGERPTWSVVEALLELSYEARYRDPRQMLELAFAAEYASRNLDPRQYPPALIADWRVRALAELGNAYRLNEDFEAAEDAFARAGDLFDEGTGDALLLARLLDLEASLRQSQRRLSEAIELLGSVTALYEQIGERHLAGRALVSMGINVHYTGQAGEAVRLLRQGISLLDANRDPQLIAISQQSLLHALVDAGDLQEARQLLLESGLRRKLAAEPLNLLKLRGVEGKIHAGQGKLWRAEAIFREVRDGFLERRMEYDAALVGLELIEVRLRQGRRADVAELAREILETFEDLGVELEALRAMRYLDEACRADTATPSMAARVRGILRPDWEPRLQFGS
jgi:tetratricopeptide (TPR) repeat protein